MSVRYYKWGYSWPELRSLYEAKCKEYAEKKEMDYQFLTDLACAALGGKKQEGVYELDSGDGLDTMTPEQEAELREALGEDFDKVYGNA